MCAEADGQQEEELGRLAHLRRFAPQAVARFKERARKLTARTRGVSLAQIVEELSRYLVRWLGYFGFCETRGLAQS
jgi:RNA-directed DNA polymerase